MENTIPQNRISVIIPCYNVENLVSECLDSVIVQTIGLEHLEIILVDDASTDKTTSVLRDYERKYPENIILVYCEKNGKQGTARNIGFSYATGDYISFIDADDLIHPDMYKDLINMAISTDCDIVQFRYKVFHGSPDNDGLLSQLIPFKVYEYGRDRKKYLLDSSVLDESCTTKLYCRELLEKVYMDGNKFAEGVAYEEPLFLYPLKFYVNRVCVTETPFYYYRANPSGTTIAYMSNPSTILEHMLVQLDVYLKMRDLGFTEKFPDEINLYFIHTFFFETLYFMAKRDYSLPANVLRYIRKTLMTYLPNYRDNVYVCKPELTEEMKCLDLLDYIDHTDAELEKKLAEYMKEIKD